jgi:hypothetical protein
VLLYVTLFHSALLPLPLWDPVCKRSTLYAAADALPINNFSLPLYIALCHSMTAAGDIAAAIETLLAGGAQSGLPPDSSTPGKGVLQCALSPVGPQVGVVIGNILCCNLST